MENNYDIHLFLCKKQDNLILMLCPKLWLEEG